jgi:hypothetical protein
MMRSALITFYAAIVFVWYCGAENHFTVLTNVEITGEMTVTLDTVFAVETFETFRLGIFWCYVRFVKGKDTFTGLTATMDDFR